MSRKRIGNVEKTLVHIALAEAKRISDRIQKKDEAWIDLTPGKEIIEKAERGTGYLYDFLKKEQGVQAIALLKASRKQIVLAKVYERHKFLPDYYILCGYGLLHEYTKDDLHMDDSKTFYEYNFVYNAVLRMIQSRRLKPEQIVSWLKRKLKNVNSEVRDEDVLDWDN